MNTIRNSNHIRTHRVLKGFHSCVNSTEPQQIQSDLGRVGYEELRRLNRERRFVGKTAMPPSFKGA